MKLISWNVNGLRACLNKGFASFFEQADADVVCLQETKMQPGQADFAPYQYWNSAEKKGYSGTAVFSRVEPLSVSYGLGDPAFDTEGRLIRLEFEHFYLVNIYTPNARRDLSRLDYRMVYEDTLREYVGRLARQKAVLICGDMNVAHREIDLKNARSNRGNAGFTDEEREKFGLLLESGFVDSFRYLYPEKEGAYTWWSYMYNARANNAGWRIDYFLVSQQDAGGIRDAGILPQVMGSDHCPVWISFDPREREG